MSRLAPVETNHCPLHVVCVTSASTASRAREEEWRSRRGGAARIASLSPQSFGGLTPLRGSGRRVAITISKWTCSTGTASRFISVIELDLDFDRPCSRRHRDSSRFPSEISMSFLGGPSITRFVSPMTDPLTDPRHQRLQASRTSTDSLLISCAYYAGDIYTGRVVHISPNPQFVDEQATTGYPEQSGVSRSPRPRGPHALRPARQASAVDPIESLRRSSLMRRLPAIRTPDSVASPRCSRPRSRSGRARGHIQLESLGGGQAP